MKEPALFFAIALVLGDGAQAQSNEKLKKTVSIRQSKIGIKAFIPTKSGELSTQSVQYDANSHNEFARTNNNA